MGFENVTPIQSGNENGPRNQWLGLALIIPPIKESPPCMEDQELVIFPKSKPPLLSLSTFCSPHLRCTWKKKKKDPSSLRLRKSRRRSKEQITPTNERGVVTCIIPIRGNCCLTTSFFPVSFWSFALISHFCRMFSTNLLQFFEFSWRSLSKLHLGSRSATIYMNEPLHIHSSSMRPTWAHLSSVQRVTHFCRLMIWYKVEFYIHQTITHCWIESRKKFVIEMALNWRPLNKG